MSTTTLGPAVEPSAAHDARWWTPILRDGRGRVAIVFLTILVLSGVLAGTIAPYDPAEQDLSVVLQGPSGDHLLGTDALGRDVLSRLMHAVLPSLWLAVIALIVFVSLGVPLGVLAGFRGGRLDSAISRTVEVLMAMPPIIVILVVLGVFSASPVAAMVTLGVLAAMGFARVVRGAALVVRNEPYVTAARVSGVRSGRIMGTHIARGVLGPVLVQATLFIGIALAVQSALAYLGLVGSADQPTFGGMIADASRVTFTDPWLLFPPGVALSGTILALGLLGDAIRDSTSAGTRRTSKRSPAAAVNAGPVLPARDGALLSVRGLAVTAHLTLVDDVSFDVLPGETVAVVGESGCGKTLTALAVLGLLPTGVAVSGGTVTFEGAGLVAGRAAGYDKVRGSGMAYVAQDALGSLDPTHTIGSHLLEVIACHEKLPKADARARALELLEQVRIPHPERVLNAYPHELSGGMAQRVNIALALAGRPRLLIADEPTTALDVTVQAEMLRLLRELRDQTGLAILLITHDWGVVADIADRVIVMYAGQVVEESPVGAVFTAARFPYTASLVAADHGRGTPGTALPTIPGRVPSPEAWPKGCRFSTRCPHAREVCTAGPLALVPSGMSLTRCVRVGELIDEGVLQ